MAPCNQHAPIDYPQPEMSTRPGVGRVFCCLLCQSSQSQFLTNVAPAPLFMPGPCFQFQSAGACAYGDRCRFAHGLEDEPSVCPGDPPVAFVPAPPCSQRTRGTHGGTQSPKSLLFITGLPAFERADRVRRRLAALLRPFRATARVGCTHEGRSRGWAHASFSCPESAEEAISALDGLLFGETPFGPRLSLCYATDKRDTLFPSLTRAQRLSLVLDSTALFSCTDGVTADRTAALIHALMQAATPGSTAWRVTDACACCGGNARAFAAHSSVASVCCVEWDARRAEALAQNAHVWGLSSKVTVHHGDFLELRSELSKPLLEDPTSSVLFIDPPWGGTDYSAQQLMALEQLHLSGTPIHELALRGLEDGHSLVALGTPRNYDDTQLARKLTACVGEREADRALPFRIEFGNRILVVALGAACFPTSGLDAYVEVLLAFNRAHGAEHHPKFFCWEKDAWVSLSRWKGAKPVKPLQADA